MIDNQVFEVLEKQADRISDLIELVKALAERVSDLTERLAAAEEKIQELDYGSDNLRDL